MVVVELRTDVFGEGSILEQEIWVPDETRKILPEL